MATTTISLGLSSSNLTSNKINLSTSFNVTSDGAVGLVETSGLTREKLPATTDTVVIDASDYSLSQESQLGYVLIRNLSTAPAAPVFTDSVIIKIVDGANSNVLGHLAGGQSAIFPFSAESDIVLNADIVDTYVEYIIVHAG
jgi:hypothetical protein